MDKTEKINEFLELLEHSDIQKKIVEIVGGSFQENRGTNEKKVSPTDGYAEATRYSRMAEESLKACQKENRVLRAQRDQLAAEKKKTEQEFKEREKRLSELEQEVRGMKVRFSQFQQLLAHYESYCGLSQKIREDLKRVIRTDDPVVFLLFGCQRENIGLLWDYVKSDRRDMDKADFDCLLELIEYLLACMNALYERPLYALMKDEVGKAYDDRRHIRADDCSVYQGEVREVVVPGIWNLNSNCAFRKSVVIV